MSDEIAPFRGTDGLELALTAVNLMGQHCIPTSPPNYEVWTAFKAGLDPDLIQTLQKRLASGQAFSDQINDEIHQRFFTTNRLSDQVVEASGTIARELAGVIDALRAAGDKSETYADALQNSAAEIAAGADHTDIVKIISMIAAASIEMAKDNRQLCAQMETSSHRVQALQTTLEAVRTEALTDSLTGLANRKMFDHTLRKHVHDSQSAQETLCLLLCDIDHFKRVNDTWGHMIGDQVIRFIGSILREHSKGVLLAARYGGEEFAILAPKTNLAEARIIAESIRVSARSKILKRRSTNDQIGAVTVSIGVALYRPGESVRDFFARADSCLYASKHGGRDRVTLDADPGYSSAA